MDPKGTHKNKKFNNNKNEITQIQKKKNQILYRNLGYMLIQSAYRARHKLETQDSFSDHQHLDL